MTSPVKLSRRSSEVPASPIRRLAPFAVAARKAGKKVYNLNIGQPDIASPPQMLERLRSFDETNVAYGPSEGLPEFIEAIRLYYERFDLHLANEEIFVTAGGSEALLFALAAIADDGDEVLLFEPFYTNYNGFAGLVGVKTVPVETHAADGYRLPPREAIEAKIGPKTRAVMICSPNNPTGTVYNNEEMERIAAICRDHDLYLISDEVYREFTYDGLKHRSALTLEGLRDKVILTDSLSKRVSLCGARIGWIATHNRELLSAILRFGQARLCPPTLGQHIGIALKDIPPSYMEGVIAEYDRRRNLVYDRLAAMMGVGVLKPEGAFYICAKLPVDDAQSFCEFLLGDFSLRDETVMLAPADGFYATPGLGKQEARIAYVLREEDLAMAMDVIAAGLEAYPGRSA
jgi:aspartate aminotransferase